jgi:hypothetical protein
VVPCDKVDNTDDGWPPAEANFEVRPAVEQGKAGAGVLNDNYGKRAMCMLT